MPRPRKEVEEAVKREIEKIEEKLAIWDLLVPLMFDADNLKILLVLRAADKGLLSFSRIGEYTRLGKGQKLIDRLNYLIRFGLVQKEGGEYRLTSHLGRSLADLSYRMISLSDKSEILGWLADLKAVAMEVEQAQPKIENDLARAQPV